MRGCVDLGMIRYISILLFIGLAWGQTTIAVFDFENNGLKKYEVRQLSTRLESEVVKIGGFRVVERTKIDEILKEQKFQMSGCVDECLIEINVHKDRNVLDLANEIHETGIFANCRPDFIFL